MWVLAEKDKDGLTLHGVIVKAFFVNEECSKIEHAYIDVSKEPPPPPSPTPTPDPWWKRIWEFLKRFWR